MSRNALGRGLGALIREPEPSQQNQPQPNQQQSQLQPQPQQQPAPGQSAHQHQAQVTSPQPIPIAPPRGGLVSGGHRPGIDPNPYQPRTRFREEALEELSRSIQAMWNYPANRAAEKWGRDITSSPAGGVGARRNALACDACLRCCAISPKNKSWN